MSLAILLVLVYLVGCVVSFPPVGDRFELDYDGPIWEALAGCAAVAFWPVYWLVRGLVALVVRRRTDG